MAQEGAAVLQRTDASATVAAMRRTLAAQFRAAAIEAPELDARILVGHALGLDHAALAAAANRTLGIGEQKVVATLAARRLAREPVARIIGHKEFWSLKLQVNAATLVPRPETETLVEAALAAIDARGARKRAMRVADLGTGTGALLFALLSELPNAIGVGTDISVEALALAKVNARNLGQRRAAFLACDMASALAGPLDVIVANPPYIATPDIGTLPPEVRDFDPRLALDGGHDGSDSYRAVAAAAPALLSRDGFLVVELDGGPSERTASLFFTAGLVPQPPRHDVNGAPRALVVERRA